MHLRVAGTPLLQFSTLLIGRRVLDPRLHPHDRPLPGESQRLALPGAQDPLLGRPVRAVGGETAGGVAQPLPHFVHRRLHVREGRRREGLDLRSLRVGPVADLVVQARLVDGALGSGLVREGQVEVRAQRAPPAEGSGELRHRPGGELQEVLLDDGRLHVVEVDADVPAPVGVGRPDPADHAGPVHLGHDPFLPAVVVLLADELTRIPVREPALLVGSCARPVVARLLVAVVVRLRNHRQPLHVHHLPQQRLEGDHLPPTHRCRQHHQRQAHQRALQRHRSTSRADLRHASKCATAAALTSWEEGVRPKRKRSLEALMKTLILASTLLLAARCAQAAWEDVFTRIDLARPGLEGVRRAAEAGDMPTAAAALKAYFRQRQTPIYLTDRFSRPRPNPDYNTDAAEKVLRREFTFVGKPYALTRDIDWNANPLDDVEWPIELNRHGTWVTLARAYWGTGDEEYADDFAYQLADWLTDNPRPASPREARWTWRTLELGIRLLGTWNEVLFRFIDSDRFTPELVCGMLEAMWEQADYLTRYGGGGNWLVCEKSALVTMGVVYP
ncbi:MAG: hypothetical protein FJX74_23995, partial [Armatimonadetes bacterium]|nr:hypothetical protein [Armatimonadota bacterium]